jgi:hypothetical protein
MTRRQLLLAGAALSGAAACRSNKKEPPPASETIPAGPPQVGACGPDDDHNPEDWYKDDLAPTGYLVNPDGSDTNTVLAPAGPPQSASSAKARVNLHSLDAAAKDRLNAAYDALAKDFPATEMKVKESLGIQALIHNRYCSDSGTGVHRSDGGLFFTWHRAYLVFHERLVQWALKNRCGVSAATADSFRLPYWNPREDPGAYGESQRLGLFRMRGPKTADPPKLTVADCMETDLKTFGDRVLAWHGEVHRWMCGQFEQAKYSAFDPLFFAFHAYVDLIWQTSAAKTKYDHDIAAAPTPPPAWYGVFFDAGKPDNAGITIPGRQAWSKVDVNQFGDPKAWGYFYTDTVTCDANTSGLEFTNVELPSSDDQIFHLVARDIRNSDNEKEIATIRPFGHVHKSYPFVRAYITREQATEYTNTDRWSFWIRATYRQMPVSLKVTGKPVIAPG